MVLKGMPWLKKQIKGIEETNSKFSNEIKIIREIKPEVFNESEHWTPLKLAFLNFTLDVCAIVAKNKFEKKNYIDLFSGSGINKTRGKYDDYLIGSPFIALLNHKEKFTKFFFCETNIDYFEALSERINALGFDNINLSPEDCNDELPDILNALNKEEKNYNFFFIDPYNLEFSWESMKKILNIRSDILFTFMPRAIWRTIATNKATGHGHKALKRVFGNNSWENATCEEDLIKIYQENILKERNDAVILDTQIKSKGGFTYNLIFITHKTKGNNPWLNPIRNAKEEIEKHSDVAIKSLLSIIKKRQMTLENYPQKY